MSSRYRVVLTGEVLAGHDPEQVRAAAAQAFRLDAGQLERLWGKRAVVKRDASEEEAVRFVARVRRLGLGAECEALEPPAEVKAREQVEPPVSKPGGAPGDDELFGLAAPVAPAASEQASGLSLVPESVTCPQCGEVQPKRTLCRKCGLDMPRYVAAKAEADQIAREEKAFEREVAAAERGTRKPSTDEYSKADARLLSFGFSGRTGRLGYLAGGFLSCLLLTLFVMVAVKTSGKTLLLTGLLVSSIYSLRVLALRLHDIGRSGWLSLLLLVPIVNFIFMLVLLFVPGDDDNDYGLKPFSSRGGAAVASFVATLVVNSVFGFMVAESPEDVQKLAAKLRIDHHKQAAPAKQEDDADDTYVAAAHYSADNLVVMYSMERCEECDSMRRWLAMQNFRYIEQRVDADQDAAERLSEKLGAAGFKGRLRLPIVEVNGVLLANNPSPRQMHRHLRLAKSV